MHVALAIEYLTFYEQIEQQMLDLCLRTQYWRKSRLPTSAAATKAKALGSLKVIRALPQAKGS